MEKALADNKSYLKGIYIISAVIPIAVAFLILFPMKWSFAGDWVKMLPAVHATINSLTVFVLVGALAAVKAGNISLHRAFMFAALVLGFLFLISYIVYHSNVESVKYGDFNYDGLVSDQEKALAGTSRTVYLIVLASHILLSIVVVPFVLVAFYFALTQQVEKHKKLVKYTYPIWMYVSVTGVIVYFMIKPFYS